jgi:hypothetical protein
MQRIELKNLEARSEVLRRRESGHGLETKKDVGNGSLRLGSPWEESAKSFRFGIAMEGGYPEIG